MRISPVHLLLALALVAGVAAVLWLMGREPICTCGYVKLWHGETVSAENSQHLADWYTATHVLHGFVFYFVLWLVARRWSIGTRLVLATAVESAWEVFENTDFVIQRYRETTISLDYYGDSIVNSAADLLVTIAGFLLAARLPVWATLALFALIEIILAVVIRDNLTLNVLMLLWPIEAVRRWQGG